MPAADWGACLVLRVQPLGDTNVIVALLTEQSGRRDVVARGAKSSRHRFAGLLQPFTELTVFAQHGRGSLDTLAEVQPLRPWRSEGVTYAQLALASYATELAIVASQPDHADLPLYHWLQAALLLAASVGDHQLRAARVLLEVSFLQALGLFPDVQQCAQCGKPNAAGAVWPQAAHGLLCLDCAGESGPRLPAAWLLVLAVLTQSPPSADLIDALPPQMFRIIEDHLASLLTEVVHQPLRSAKALKALID